MRKIKEIRPDKESMRMLIEAWTCQERLLARLVEAYAFRIQIEDEELRGAGDNAD